MLSEKALARRAKFLAWQKNNKDQVNAKNRAWRAKNKEKAKASRQKWALANYELDREIRRRGDNRRYKENPKVQIMSRLRCRLRSAIMARPGRIHDHEAVEFLTWCLPSGDLTLWHIDHLFPLSSPEGLALGNDPTNVRWLLAGENVRKQDDFPSQQEVDEHMLLVAAWSVSK